MLKKAKNYWTTAEAAHLLRRAGFGGTPAEIEELQAKGREQAVESLLWPKPQQRRNPIPTWARPQNAWKVHREQQQDYRELKKLSKELSEDDYGEKRKEIARKYNKIRAEQRKEAEIWWFQHLLTTGAPLVEKMVLFWHDHFATSIQKSTWPATMVQQNRLFRTQALENFRELARAVMRDPAMLIYLDGRGSSKKKPNENFARELMELFTLGEGKYTEEDIREAARAFTGMRFSFTDWEFRQYQGLADLDEKTIFGETGKFDADQVIDLIFRQSAAARFLPTKLWEYFVAENPSKKIIDQLAGSSKTYNFELRPLLREIFLSEEFYKPEVMGNQIKCPLQFLTQMCRELELDSLPHQFAIRCQRQLGQVVFQPPNVSGWSWGQNWITTNTLLDRYNFAGVVTTGGKTLNNSFSKEDIKAMPKGMRSELTRVNGIAKRMLKDWPGPDYQKLVPPKKRSTPETIVAALTDRLFQQGLGQESQKTFLNYAKILLEKNQGDAQIAMLTHFMMSTPEYQLM